MRHGVGICFLVITAFSRSRHSCECTRSLQGPGCGCWRNLSSSISSCDLRLLHRPCRRRRLGRRGRKGRALADLAFRPARRWLIPLARRSCGKTMLHGGALQMNARAVPDRGLRPGGSITHRMDDYGSSSEEYLLREYPSSTDSRDFRPGDTTALGAQP
jgi:hypothetical protein